MTAARLVPRTMAQRLAAVVAAALLILTASAPHAGSTHDPQFHTQSYYIANVDYDDAYDLGCANAPRRGRLTLFFGSPVEVGGEYGAHLWSAPDQSVEGIKAIVRSFVRGYADCRSTIGRLLIGIGTSNSTVDSRSDAWLRGHGQAWSEMVKELHDWATTYYYDRAWIYGAWDAEPSWSAFSKADNWMTGYDNNTASPRPLHANFSADGCPQYTAGNGACNNGWTQAAIYHLAWEHGPSLPMPQIYATTGANARQWQKISEWGAHHHAKGAMWFPGPMTQEVACQQRGGCHLIDNTPHEAHTQLTNELNSHPATAQGDIPFTTDMAWFE